MFTIKIDQTIRISPLISICSKPFMDLPPSRNIITPPFYRRKKLLEKTGEPRNSVAAYLECRKRAARARIFGGSAKAATHLCITRPNKNRVGPERKSLRFLLKQRPSARFATSRTSSRRRKKDLRYTTKNFSLG